MKEKKEKKGKINMAIPHKNTPQQRYDKAHTIGLYLKINKKTDWDILEQLEAVENKQGYIKALIRKDINKN